MSISPIHNTIARTRAVLKVSLFNNASYLIGLQFATSFLNFFFWAVAARLYPAEQVGLATTILSVAMFLSGVAGLGLPDGLIYYLPRAKEPTRLINTCLSVSAVAAMVFAIVFVAGLTIWSPALLVLRGSVFNVFLFILGTMILNLMQAQDVLFAAERTAKLSFFKGLLINIAKFPLLFLTVFVAEWNVLFASIILASFLGVVVYGRQYQRTVRPDYEPAVVLAPRVWGPIMGYSLGVFIADSISMLPNFVIPVIVLSRLGAAASAYFFVAWTIGGTLSVVGRSLGLALFAESGHDATAIGKNALRSFMFGALVLVPGVLAIMILGRPVLLFFGRDYGQEGAVLATILAASSIPLTIYRIAAGVLKGRGKIKPLMVVTSLDVGLHIGCSLWLIPTMGLMGVGVAKLLADSVAAPLAVFLAFPHAIRSQLLKLHYGLAGRKLPVERSRN